jgi:hypothetical protein
MDTENLSIVTMLILVLLVFSFVTSFPSSVKAAECSPPPFPPRNWQHHTDNQFQVSVSFPPGWFIFEKPSGNLVVSLRNPPFESVAGILVPISGFTISIIPGLDGSYYTPSDFSSAGNYINEPGGTNRPNPAINAIVNRYINFLQNNAPGFQFIDKNVQSAGATVDYYRTVSPFNTKVWVNDILWLRGYDHNLAISSTYYDSRLIDSTDNAARNYINTMANWIGKYTVLFPCSNGSYIVQRSNWASDTSTFTNNYCIKDWTTFHECVQTMNDIATLRHCATKAVIYGMSVTPHSETYDSICHVWH